MDFQEIKKKFDELNITPSMLGDNFENYCENNTEDVDYSDSIKINIFGEDIVEETGSYNDLSKKIDKRFREIFGDYSYNRTRNNDDVTVIFCFQDHDVYVMLDGWYSSYRGDDFSDATFKQVRPQEKVIITYKQV